MTRDYENVDGLESMSDQELAERIRQEFRDTPALDPDLVDVRVEEGRVTLTGRVGTEGELQVFEHVVTDVLGIKEIVNEIVVDELVRATASEAADTTERRADRTSDTAEHLQADIAAEQFGTDDVGEAIERGHTYEPPPGPIQEGTESRELH